MREILERLLKPTEPVRRFCSVQGVNGDGTYVVVDDLQRKYTVDGDAGYLPGNDVIVQAGRIVRRGKRRTGNTYRV
jgi:hypothetical protein